VRSIVWDRLAIQEARAAFGRTRARGGVDDVFQRTGQVRREEFTRLYRLRRVRARRRSDALTNATHEREAHRP